MQNSSEGKPLLEAEPVTPHYTFGITNIKNWSQSIPFKLAKTAALVGIVVGLILSCAQVFLDYQNEKNNLEQQIEQIVSVAHLPAQRSAFEVNREVAQEVVDGLLRYDFITSASIYEEVAGILANAARDSFTIEASPDKSLGFPKDSVYKSTFVHPIDSPTIVTREFGFLEVHVNKQIAMQPFTKRSLYVVLSGVVRSMALVSILAIVYHWMLGRSLVKLAVQLQNCSPCQTNPLDIPADNKHQNDELGLLRGAIVDLLQDSEKVIKNFKSSEELLKEKGNRYRDIAIANSDWFWETDNEGKFRYISERFLTRTKLPKTRVLNHTPVVLTDILLEPGTFDHSDTGWEKLTQAIGQPVPFRDLRCRLIVNDYVQFVFSIGGKPYYDKFGNWVGFRGAATDITQIVVREIRYRQAQKMQAIRQLTSGLSHDFNNLLSVISMSLELVLDSDEIEHSHRELLESAYAAGERGATQLQRLHCFAHSQSLLPTTVNVNDLIQQNLQVIKRTLGENISVDFVSDAQLWQCSIDIERLASTLLNLVLNARDAMSDGGKMILSTQNVNVEEESMFGPFFISTGQYVVITVQDNGHGMDEDQLSKIFEPYFTTKEAGVGNGLGLSTAYGFVKQSGGHLVANSEVGIGSYFRLYLPRTAQCLPAEKNSSSEAVLEPTTGKTVFVVEDEREIREMLEAMLIDAGYKVSSAYDANSAIEMITAGEPPDLLLTDVLLVGGKDGIALYEDLLEAHPELKVMFLSGHARVVTVNQNGIEYQYTILKKPFKRAALLQRVQEELKNSSATLVRKLS